MILQRLYSTLWLLATPLVRRYLRKRAIKAPAYLEHWDERFGTALLPRRKGAIWVHAVSVGETRAALPLINALRKQWPEAPLLVTQMTPTGRACAEDLYGENAEIRYLPYDYPQAVRQFIACYSPKFGVLMETEIWPNLIDAADWEKVPLFLANARLSEKSLSGYRKIGCLIRSSLRKLTSIAAQTDEDASRLLRLGARHVVVCGNTKYDVEPPLTQLELGKHFRQLIGSRRVVVCASTRANEEGLIFDAWRRHTQDCLLVVVPRHPERFAEVGELARRTGFTVQYRSDMQPVDKNTQVWIGDSMGELLAYYAAADLVFIGGSLLPLGGQNLIEPASLGIPVLMGPSTYNFSDASDKAFKSGAAIQVSDADDMVDKINRLLVDENRRKMMSKAALEFSKEHRGASLRIVEMIVRTLEKDIG
jgi:3-deoxy-D-manno-octulosonic-acid transferase